MLTNLAERHADSAIRDSAALALRLDGVNRQARRTAQPTPPNNAPAGPKRQVCDAHSSELLPGATVRQEGAQPTGDACVDQAYDNLGITYDFFLKAYARDSIDGAGCSLQATAHYGERYDNAFWNGERMVYGDGDATLFRPFTGPIEISAHELTHGVTQYTAKLAYEGESGALNESISDIFGVLVKQYHFGQATDQADWLIGAGLFTPGVHGVALRSMKEPGSAYDDPVLGKDPQPASMSGFVETEEDNGGVHINSGIPSRAFYLVAAGLGGYAWERAGRIWFETLTGGKLTPKHDFADFAEATADTAARLYGQSSGEVENVKKAWIEVGVTR